MRRFGCLILIVAAALVWGGGQGLYTALRNRAPVEMTCAEYLQSRPRAEWLALTDCVVVLPEASHFQRRSASPTAAATEIYVPVVAPGDEESAGSPYLILVTEDPQLLNLYNEIGRFNRDTTGMDEWLERYGPTLVQRRNLTGLIQFGIELSSDRRDKLVEAYGRSDMALLDDGAAPDWGLSLVLFVIGLGLLFVLLWKFARGRRSAETPPETAPPPA